MSRRNEKFPDNGFEAWGGYMQAKISKLEEQFSSKASKENQVSDIFKGISIFVNGYTVPTADELKDLMAQHGGVYHTYQRHEDIVIASNLPDTKVKNMSLANIVKPEWITKSIASNQLLDYKDFLLYSNKHSQPKLKFQKSMRMSIDKKNKELSNNSWVEPFHKLDIERPLPDSSCGFMDSTNSLIDKNTDTCTKTAVDPDFITEFYSNSRLHHISQLGACFKQYINDLREESNYIFAAQTNLRDRIKSYNHLSSFSMNFEYNKIIMHIDMDCFFVSVGLRKHPELKGKPVAVTHSKGGQSQTKRTGVNRSVEFELYRQKQAEKLTKAGLAINNIEISTRIDNIGDEDNKFGSMSEIASCSYEARAKGIHNGMFLGAALRLCPELQTIPYDFEGYKEVAYTLYNTIAQYTLDIEAVSCDEMYVHCTDLLKNLNVSPEDFATVLREEIREKTGCPCSTGFGGNRLQARLATKQAKPNGQFFLTANLIEDFMFDINLKDLPGVGRQTSQKLESLGHKTCGSLQSLTLASLQQHLGNKTGAQLFDQCRGRDRNPLTYHTVRKSVSAEVNYGIRFQTNDQCYKFLNQLSVEVQSRMQQFKVKGKCITLKLMVRSEEAPVETAKFLGHGFCDVINKSVSLLDATNDSQVILQEVISLCKKLNIDPKEMRGIGIQVTKLEQLNDKLQKSKGAISKFLTNVTKDEKKDKLNLCLKNDSVSPKQPVVSPRRKSPILGTSRSPNKRKGRPPKILKLNTSKNLMDKFLQCPAIKNEFKSPIKNKFNDIEEPKKNIENIETKRIVKSGLLGLSWKQVRELLRAWFDSGQPPKQCDVNMIISYMEDMICNRNIDKLYILINFFRRRIHEINNEIWNEVLNYVMEQVQSSMMVVYNKRLHFED
ncbi:DNA repair protein Rev1 [Pieris rapae]|uniref:DNA repair protein Rev1 n=1 Tax=Pieris rapae TaxID=64459 RepID=UPI001E2808E6|nr:DNA repair protein Rev1 [Pieris rapae]